MGMAARAAAREITHEEQLVVWADEMTEALLPWLKEPESYDDKVNLSRAIKDELRTVVAAAFELAYGD